MTSNTTRLEMPLIEPSQTQKHVTHSQAMEVLDATTPVGVVYLGENQPPLGPSAGDIYVIGDAPTGEWLGNIGLLAYFSHGGWLFLTPKEGWRIGDVATQGSWSPLLGTLQNVDGLGIGTSYDVDSLLAVSSPSTILSIALRLVTIVFK